MRGARGQVDAGVLRASGLHGELRDRAAKPVEGSGRSAVRAEMEGGGGRPEEGDEQ